MSGKRKLTAIAAVGMIVVIGGAASLFVVTGREGGGGLERWIGRQIVGVLEAYTNTSTSFDELDYQAPGTVVVTRVSMTGGGQELIAADRLLLELAEVPSLDKPIQIARIEVDAPRLTFVQAQGGGFIGWNDFIPPEVLADPDSVPEGRRASDVLELRHVEIADGELVYDAGDGSESMVFRGITTAMDTEPEADAPGWYRLAGTLGRPPVSTIEVDARLNIDTATLELAKLAPSIHLNEQQYANFPPQIQTHLRNHEVKGHLTADISGTLELKAWRRSEIEFKVNLADGRVAAGDKVIPVESVSLTGGFAGERVVLNYEASLLDGQVAGESTLRLTGPLPMTATWNAEYIKIEQTVRALTEGPPPYAGTVRSRGTIEADLAAWPHAVAGGGTIDVEEGRLVVLPGMSDLMKLMKVSFNTKDSKPRDRAHAKFAFTPKGVRIDESEVQAPYLAGRAQGMIFFDATIDLDVNAGPLEKVQSLLGKAGEWLGKVSDKIVTYRIHGPIQSPKVSVKPFGTDMGK